jgi:hypothetical protein
VTFAEGAAVRGDRSIARYATERTAVGQTRQSALLGAGIALVVVAAFLLGFAFATGDDGLTRWIVFVALSGGMLSLLARRP